MSLSKRLRSAGRWMRTHRRRTAVIAIFGAFALLNAWAYRHAWAMTHYSSGGKSTIRPEAMSVCGRVRVLLTGVNLPRPVNSRTPSDVGLPFETHRIEVP